MKNSLNKEIWKYFLIFSVAILGFLWFFQVLFFNKYYRFAKIKNIKEVASTIIKKQNSINFTDAINTAAYKNEVCVEIIDNNFLSVYNSSIYGKGCFTGKNISMNYKYDFISSNVSSKTYELINPAYNNNTLVFAVKLNGNQFAFVNTSLDPIDGAISIIRDQLIIITILVLALSFIISYFISKYISLPIVRISDTAKKMAKGNFNVNFDTNSNIVEIDELANTLNYTSNELYKTDELRRDLMANVSHDLKTPLTMIKAYAEMCNDLHANSKKKRLEDMNVIIEEADRLAILVDDILTLSKVQSNIDKLVYEDFDLIKLVTNIIERYNVLKDMENYQFIFNYNVNKLIIRADKKKIEQVIYNLINNAINYTGNDNKIIIDITKESDSIKVSISDTGKGIEKEKLPYIWEKYYKNEKKHKRNLVGTGLGLSIVKNILLLHDYDFGVVSELNKGSTFYFIINEKNIK